MIDVGVGVGNDAVIDVGVGVGDGVVIGVVIVVVVGVVVVVFNFIGIAEEMLDDVRNSSVDVVGVVVVVGFTSVRFK